MKISMNEDYTECMININNWYEIVGEWVPLCEQEIELDGSIYVRDRRSDCGDYMCYKIKE